MFTNEDMQALEALMNETLENRELLEKLIASHKYNISKISHEIRNPLTLVYSTIQLIQAQHPEVIDFKHWGSLVEDVEFMKILLEALSNYNNGDTLTLETIDLCSILKHLVLSFATSIVDTKISFISRIPPTLPTIQADQTKLKEVLLNLLRNAQDAVDSTGTIRLLVSQTDTHIIINIEDSGCGIPPEQLDSIFTPFVTYKQGGTGLGLAIAQKTIKAHNGTIELHSELQVGTIFTITLPIQ
ncbi:MAG: ATP-binding protein [Lachnospiraceae bacterium]